MPVLLADVRLAQGGRWALTLTFYLLGAALVALIMTKAAQQILPSDAAVRLGHNSEAVTMCVLIAALVQLVRVAGDQQRWRRLTLGAIALLSFAIAAVLNSLRGDVDPVIATLTEAFSAAGFVALYLAGPRSARLAVVVSGLLLVLVVGLNRTEFVTLQSEALVTAVLTPLLVDVICPRVLVPTARDRPELRWAWCIALAALPMLIGWLHAQDPAGVFGEAVHYGHRAFEAFIATLVLTLYFAALVKVDELDDVPTTRVAEPVGVGASTGTSTPPKR